MARVERRRLLPAWLGHGFEAGALGALLSGGTLVAFRLSGPAPRVALQQGIDGSLILVPALLALGVLATSLPIFLAATRAEATLGALTGFLVAADLLMLVSLISRQSIFVHALSHSLPLGVVAALLSIPSVLVGLAVGPLTSELGFGHSAGLRAAIGAAVAVLPLALVGPFVA
jgi:hypothetical protein